GRRSAPRSSPTRPPSSDFDTGWRPKAAHFRQKSGAKNRPSGKGLFMMCNRSGLVHTTAATVEPDKDKVG
ncbi:hypothetical protein PMAYCL1PPCAC_04983, partial [Pristionchus mayeri]